MDLFVLSIALKIHHTCIIFFNSVEPIAGTPPSQSLEDVTLDEDIDLEQQLNDFLQTDQQEENASGENEETKETLENVET